MSNSSKYSVEKRSASSMVGSVVGRGGRGAKREESEGSKANKETWAVASTLLEEEYEMMKDLYDVAEATGIRWSNLSVTVQTPEKGYVAVYESHF